MKGQAFLIVLLLCFLTLVLVPGLALGQADYSTVEAKKMLFQQKCSGCHSLELATKEPRARARWEILMRNKQSLTRDKGAPAISDAEAAALVNYLADYLGPEIGRARQYRARLFLAGTFAFFALMAFIIYIGVKQRRREEKI